MLDFTMENSEAFGSAEPPGAPAQTGDAAYAGLLRYEWRAHRALWLAASAVILAASLGAGLFSGREPLWAALVAGFCDAVLILAALALLAFALAWRHLRKASETLHFEKRSAFIDAAGGALLRRIGLIAIIVMAAETINVLLPA